MRRLYQLLLLAFSSSMRRRWGDDMARLAQDQMDDARRRGESRARVLWLLAWDAIHNGIGERVSRARSRIRRPGGARAGRRTSTRGGDDVAWMNGWVREWVAGLRQIRRRPGSVGAAVMLLAVGIGASTAVFSVVDAVLVRALPLPDPGRIVRVFSVHPTYGEGNVSLPELEDWEREGGPFVALGGYYSTVHSLMADGVPQRVVLGRTVGDLFGAAGLEAALGRTYPPGDPGTAGEATVLLTDAFWRRSFGAERSVIGRTIDLDGRPVRVSGVLPPEEETLRVGRAIDAWAPMDAPLPWMGRATGFLTVLGHLRPDLSAETAEQPLLAMANGLVEAGNTENGIAMQPLKEALVGDSRTLLLAMQGAGLLLMLVVAINAANVLLARSLDRSGEFALRAALGAGRGTLARQVLIETTLTGLLGGALGLGLALLGRDLILDLVPQLGALAGPAELDWRLLTYALLSALGAGVLAGLWPALRASRHAWTSIKTGARRGSTRAHAGQRAMVAVEMAVTLVLIVGAGLMARTVTRLLDVDLGFEPAGVLTAHVTLPEPRYPDAAQRHAFWNDLVDRVGTVPGVAEAGLTSALPLSRTPDGGSFDIEGRPWDGAEAPSIDKKAASPGYFAAMGIPVLEGRAFGPEDREDSRPVTIVSQSMARRYFPDESALGRRIRLHWWGDDFLEIVGVAGDIRQRGPDEEAEIAAYVPYAQIGATDAALVVRATGNPTGLTNAVRDAVLELDPEQPIYAVSTLDELVVAAVGSRSALRSLLLAVSGLALLISCIGVYGVTAQAVRRRRHEIGVRKALGASGTSLLGVTMLAEARVIGVGVVLGLAAAAMATRSLRAFLFGISALDPTTLLVSVAALGSAGLLAVLGPAWRAARTDPRRCLSGSD